MSESEPELFADLAAEPENAAPAAPRTRRSPAPRLPAEQWRALLACEETAAAYEAATYRDRPEAECCHYWTGALSSSGHGKIKAGRAAGGAAGTTVTAHVYGYQRAHGLIVATPDLPDPVVAHTCDESSCQNPAHWELISRGANMADYHRRRHRWPLTDTRLTKGRKSARAEALRAAIKEAQRAQAAAEALRTEGRRVPADLAAAADTETALHRASEAGRPPEPLTLF